jgi:hypothetical protein
MTQVQKSARMPRLQLFAYAGGYADTGYDDEEYPPQQPYPHPGIRGVQYGGDGRQYPAGGGTQWNYEDRYAQQGEALSEDEVEDGENRNSR